MLRMSERSMNSEEANVQHIVPFIHRFIRLMSDSNFIRVCGSHFSLFSESLSVPCLISMY